MSEEEGAAGVLSSPVRVPLFMTLARALAPNAFRTSCQLIFMKFNGFRDI